MAMVDRAIAQRMTRKMAPRQGWAVGQVGLHLTIVILLLLSLIPTYLMLLLSFKNGLQYRWERWSLSLPLRGSNYTASWQVIDAFMWNTLLVAVVGLAGVLLLSLIGGYVFARMRFPLREPLYYAIISLLMVPWVLSFIPAYMLYNDLGLLNSRWALIIPNIAGGPIFGIFLLRAFITGIPEELFESARCDGAGVWSLIWHITLPLSLPGLATLAVLNFIESWNSFLWPLVTISDASLQVISVGLYKLSRITNDGVDFGAGGPLFAGYVLASLPLVILFFILGKFYVEGLMESGIKV
ncbi:MAG: carbohydrate ABC transporter permease [Caldilinea sp. CFX5]|nr:carbohydrate ABC transporter permease [Caldilinea sp. CFX5]